MIIELLSTVFFTELANGAVNATMRSVTEVFPRDNSTRWLVGEDVAPGGALRDMYKPTCYGNPGKVSDAEYTCDLFPGSDNGGVHVNSGIPNHAYALLVDGGTYNGQTIEAIGLTKAAHVYFRAMAVYQVANSNFADHADSLEQSATDLIAGNANLTDLKTGAPSNHGTYVNRVSILTDQWVAAGIITDAQKGAIMKAVAQNKL